MAKESMDFSHTSEMFGKIIGESFGGQNFDRVFMVVAVDPPTNRIVGMGPHKSDNEIDQSKKTLLKDGFSIRNISCIRFYKSLADIEMQLRLFLAERDIVGCEAGVYIDSLKNGLVQSINNGY